MPGPKRGFTTPHTCTTVDSWQEINLWKEIEKPEKNYRKRYQTFKSLLMITLFEHRTRGKMRYL